jgi:hypothetical protein
MTTARPTPDGDLLLDRPGAPPGTDGEMLRFPAV